MTEDKIAETNAIIHAQVNGPSPLLPPQEAVSTDPIYAMMERAGRDPNFDVDKFERLVRLSKEMRVDDETREAEAAFNTAMSSVQSKMRRIAADAHNTQTKSKYATFGAIDRALRPLYSEAGFALTFDTGEEAPAEHIRVLCRVTHTAPGAKNSFTRVYHVDMPADGKGAKGGDVMTKTHAAGSAYSYGQRYLERMIFNIAIGNDDDGNAASADPEPKMTAEDLAILNKAIADTNTNVEQFLDFLQADALESLNITQWNIAMNWLAQKQARAKKQAEKAAP